MSGGGVGFGVGVAVVVGEEEECRIRGEQGSFDDGRWKGLSSGVWRVGAGPLEGQRDQWKVEWRWRC